MPKDGRWFYNPKSPSPSDGASLQRGRALANASYTLGLLEAHYLFSKMAKTRIQKEEALKTLSSVLKDSKSVVFAGFDKLTVGEITSTRKAMRAAGVKMLAVKKTLLGKALSDSSFGELPPLTGQVALAYSEDLLAPAREVFVAGKKLEGKLTILGGLFEGALADKDRMTSIASIPSREVLLGQFVNLINSPIQGLVIALSEISKKKTV